MSDVATWLAEAEGQVATAQRVLSDVDRGLVVAAKVEQAGRRARPVLRLTAKLVLVGLVGLGIWWTVNRWRQLPMEVAFELEPPPQASPTDEAPDNPPAPV